jgi:DNA-binding helix-turn-helix protein
VKEGQTFMKEFNKLINERLKELDISKYKLAKLTGIFEQTIYSILKGESKNPRLDHVIKIATVLDIDLNKLKGE